MRTRLATLALVIGACAPPGGTPPAPAPAAAEEGAAPPIPLIEGPLAVHVVYPRAGALVQARDSNFIFGSVGHGGAALRINGTPVPVLPNGSFLAFLPVPPPPQPTYELVAVQGADTMRLTHPVQLLPPVPALASTGPLRVDTSSVTPTGRLVLPDSEAVRVSVRAPATASVRWHGGEGVERPLLNMGALPRAAADDSLRWATDVPAADLRAPSELRITRGADTVRLSVPIVAPLPDARRWVMLGGDSIAAGDTDRVIVARPTAGGTYKWFLFPGTVLELTGRQGDFARVRLSRDLEVWVNAADARELPDGWPAPRRVARNARLVPDSGWVDLVIPMAERPAYLVEQGEEEITLTLYGVRSDTDIISHGRTDSLVRLVRWTQETGDRAVYRLRLGAPAYGHLALWDRGRFILRVRRPPVVDPERPLAGLSIAVDPGHPPVGATGPTGLYEAEATLAVGERVRELLEARGARVVMTRTDMSPVALADRPIIARRADAHALVSIHLNALPDGVNPFTAHGTGSYYFHPQSAPLARRLQAGMLRRMGLRDLGIWYDNLALARPTWMPAVLVEGAFIMIPEQEAALRTPEFQMAYARGIVDGLEGYFRSLVPAR